MASRTAAPAPAPATGRPAAQSRQALLMQVLAHPDDDLYFMNPDSQHSLTSGVPLVCVYVTAGESKGRNKYPGNPRPRPDKAAYSSARHQGLRQSYAVQLGLPIFTSWDKSVVELEGGYRAEVNTLEHRGRRVELVYLNLAMHTPLGHMGLPTLWRRSGIRLRTVAAEGSPLQSPQSYDYDSLINVLVGLFRRYRPTLVHTLDPDPDIQAGSRETAIRNSEQVGYSDHADHTAVAEFTWAALARWSEESPGGPPPFVATAFRGYYNHHWPENLPRQVLHEKAEHLVPYGADPSWQCGNPGGCGDYNVGGDAPLRSFKKWVRSTHYRYPGPRAVLAEGPDGRLTAYGVLGMRAVRWREGAGGGFGDPVDLGGGPLAPVLGSATLQDGRQLLFGLRLASISGRGGPNVREIVVLEQARPDGAFKAWSGLGNPERHPDRGRRIGVPVAVTAKDGSVHLFVRNAAQGISTRVRDVNGTWSAWRDLGGSQIQDGLTATVGSDGDVHVYGPGRDTVHHWTPRGPAPLDGLAVPADAVAVSGERVYYRAPVSSSLISASISPTGAQSHPVVFPGYGPVSAAGDCLLGRGLDGRLQMLYEGRIVRMPGAVTAGTTVTAGSRGAAVSLDGPALRITRNGPAAVGLAPDARPWLWRPKSDRPAGGTARTV
nr:PIG-L family deacetylase [Streptomyces cavernae]